MQEPIFLIVDLFCGFGGTTTGFVKAEIAGEKIAKVIACINHDPKAIKSHWLNHPEVKHFEEDIRTLNLNELVGVVSFQKALYPNAKVILWASLECTNFSKAKGGMPRDADSRTLAESLYMHFNSETRQYRIGDSYIQRLNPDYIKIENVVEFMSWGPLDDNGKPLSRKNGQDFMRWRKEVCELGYYDEWKELNSADFGAYTSRNRLFGCFAKHGLPIIWPNPTHSKKPSINGMYGDLKKWKAVKDVLDFSDEGISIFKRNKPLSEKTLERIYAGLIKYVAKGDVSFISKYYSGKPQDKNITTDGPAGTVTTIDSQALVQAEFIVQRNTGKAQSKIVDVNGPARTLTATGGNQDLVQPEFIAAYYSQGGQLSSIENPSPTIPTKDRLSLIKPEYFIDKHFGKAQNQSIYQPAGAILPTDKHRLVEVEYLMNPCWKHQVHSVNESCPTIIATQNKTPLYFVQIEAGFVSIAVYENDSPFTISIKNFMAAYGLIDIKMRMLRVHELLKIQGFPESYQMVGNQSDHKKFIGNSVHPKVPKAWAEASGARFLEILKAKVA